MIIPRHKKRAMSVFRVLEFTGDELTIKENGREIGSKARTNANIVKQEKPEP
jgi:hypothetical protein